MPPTQTEMESQDSAHGAAQAAASAAEVAEVAAEACRRLAEVYCPGGGDVIHPIRYTGVVRATKEALAASLAALRAAAEADAAVRRAIGKIDSHCEEIADSCEPGSDAYVDAYDASQELRRML